MNKINNEIECNKVKFIEKKRKKEERNKIKEKYCCIKKENCKKLSKKRQNLNN